MKLSVNTKQVPFRSLLPGDLVVVGRKLRRVIATNDQRRSVTVSLGESGTDSFPADWFHEGALWTVADV